MLSKKTKILCDPTLSSFSILVCLLAFCFKQRYPYFTALMAVWTATVCTHGTVLTVRVTLAP